MAENSCTCPLSRTLPAGVHGPCTDISEDIAAGFSVPPGSITTTDCHKWLKLQFPFPSQLNYSQRHVSVNYVYVGPAAVADHHVRSLSWWLAGSLAGQPLRSNQARAGNLLTVSFPSNSSTVQISRHSILYSYCLSTYLQIYQDKLLQLRLISLRDVDIHKCILLLTRDLQSRPRN